MGAEATERADRGGAVSAITHSALLIVGAFLAGLALTIVGGAVLQASGFDLLSPSPAVNAGLTALQFVGFLAVAYWYLEGVGDWGLVHARRPGVRAAGWVLLGLVGLYVLNWLLAALLTALDVQVATNQVVTAGREQPPLLVYLAVVSLLFVAPGEELLFRGLVQGLLRRAFGVTAAVVGASATFGLVHVVALLGPGVDPTLESVAAYVSIAGVLGLVLGALYERTETLLVPIAVHGLWNAYQFLLVYAVEMGYVDVPV